MLKKILKWLIYPGTPQTREIERFFQVKEKELPKMIRYCEGKCVVLDCDREYFLAHIEHYREVYREAESLGQTNPLERDIIRLENAVFRGLK